MSELFNSALKALPPLVGAILGLKLYVEWPHFVCVPFILLVAAFFGLFLGRALILIVPRIAWALNELWILSAVAVVSICTCAVLAITVNTPIGSIVDTSMLNKDALDAVSKTFIGAVSAYVAFVWTKDVDDGKGIFWPSASFRTTLKRAYGSIKPPPVGTSLIYAACFLDDIQGIGEVGWSLGDRYARAKVLSGNL